MSATSAETDRLRTWRGAGATFQFHGHEFFYRDTGPASEAPVLVLLHGFPTASWDWHTLWDELAGQFRMVAPDFLGFGFSDKPSGYDYSLFEQASMVEELLQAKGIDEFHVLAHDYGDTVAQELLARHDERIERGGADRKIRSVCLLNGGLFYEAIEKRPIQWLLESPVGGLVSRLVNRPLFEHRFASIFGPYTKPTERELGEFWHIVSHGGGARVAHEVNAYLGERKRFRDRWAGALRETDVPLRFVVGLEDPVSGASIARRYREVVPRPDVVEFEAIGHYPQTEAPRRTLAAYLSFARQYVDGGS